MLVGIVVLTGACGASSSTTSPSSSTVGSGHVVRPVSAQPSKSARMICSPEARDVSLTNRPTHLKLIERIETIEALQPESE